MALRSGSKQRWQLQEGTLHSERGGWGVSHLFRGFYPATKGFGSHRVGQSPISARLGVPGRAGSGSTEPGPSQGRPLAAFFPGSALLPSSPALSVSCPALPCPPGMVFDRPETRFSGGQGWHGQGVQHQHPSVVRGAAALPCTRRARGAESAFFRRAGCLPTQPPACPEPCPELPWAAVHKLQDSILPPAGCAGLTAVQLIDSKDFGGDSVLGQG